jgi:hypothetical protein
MKIIKVYGVLPTFIFTGKWFNKIPFYKHAVGITIANMVWVHNMDEEIIIDHEIIHVKQFYRYFGFNGFMYLTDRGRLWLETQAYCESNGNNLNSCDGIANVLKRHYRFDYSYKYIHDYVMNYMLEAKRK